VGIRTGEHAGLVVQDPVEFSFGSSRFESIGDLLDHFRR
jgi:hypothetical protein